SAGRGRYRRGDADVVDPGVEILHDLCSRVRRIDAVGLDQELTHVVVERQLGQQGAAGDGSGRNGQVAGFGDDELVELRPAGHRCRGDDPVAVDERQRVGIAPDRLRGVQGEIGVVAGREDGAEPEVQVVVAGGQAAGAHARSRVVVEVAV